MAIRKIDTTIQQFSVTPSLYTDTFPEDIDVYNTELPSRIASQNAMGIEMNEMATDMDTVAAGYDAKVVQANATIDSKLSLQATYLSETKSARDGAINAKSGAEIAYQNTQTLIENMVIPEEDTLSVDAINDLVSRTNNLRFVGLI